MSKIIFAALMLSLTWVSVKSQAQQVAWTCTYQPASAELQQDPAINKGLPLSEILQINIGPEKVVSHGTMNCLSPVVPTPVFYSNVVAVSEMFTIGANLGLRPSVLQSSIELDAGVSTSPQGMFRKHSAVLTGNGNVLVARIGAGGGLALSPNSLSAIGKVNASLTQPISLGGDVQLGTIQLYNVNARMKRLSLR